MNRAVPCGAVFTTSSLFLRIHRKDYRPGERLVDKLEITERSAGDRRQTEGKHTQLACTDPRAAAGVVTY